MRMVPPPLLGLRFTLKGTQSFWGGSGGLGSLRRPPAAPTASSSQQQQHLLTPTHTSPPARAHSGLPAEVSRSRSRFFRDQLPLLLYTGRTHFFFRHRLRGARHLVMHGLPESDVYGELLGMLDEAAQAGHRTSSLAIFTKYDQFALERALGAANAREVLTAQKQAFVFC